jgi:hypothetical protein
MATLFPSNLDSLINPTATDQVSVISHSGQHSDINDAVEALESKIGIDNSAVATSLDYLIKNTSSKLGKIASLAVTDSNIIVGDGTNWVAESGATARTSLGLGTGNSPTFTQLNIENASGGYGIGWGGTSWRYSNIWGAYASGDLVLGANVDGGKASDIYLSSTVENASRTAIRLAAFGDDGVISFLTATATTTAVGSEVTMTERMRINSAGLVTVTGNVNNTGVYQIDGVQVISNRVVDARCDDAINSGDATTDGVIDSLRDAMITHGLISAA